MTVNPNCERCKGTGLITIRIGGDGYGDHCCAVMDCDDQPCPECEEWSERFEYKPLEFVGVASPTLVYIGVEKREDFDKLALPCRDNGPNDQGHVLVKSGYVGDVMIVFQHWLLSKTVDALIADAKARKPQLSLQPEGKQA